MSATTATTLIRAHQRAAWLALMPYLPVALAQVLYFDLSSSYREVDALLMSWLLYTGYTIVCSALVVSQLREGGIWSRIVPGGFITIPIVLGAISVAVGSSVTLLMTGAAGRNTAAQQIGFLLMTTVVGAMFGAYLNRFILALSVWPVDDPALRWLRPVNITSSALAVTAAAGTGFMQIRNGEPTQSLVETLLFIALAGPVLYATVTLMVRDRPEHVRRVARRRSMHSVIVGILALACLAVGHRIWALHHASPAFLNADLKNYFDAVR